MKKEKGFTLMEMLIVVAIIAVLVAIAIPTFSSSLSKARKAACLANRRGLYAVVSENYLLTEEIHATELTAEEAKQFVCPEGGTITVSFDKTNHRFDVDCSEHGSLFDAGDGAESFSSPIKALKDAMDAVEKNGTVIWNGSRKRVDSTTTLPGSASGKIKDELAKAGVDLDSLGAKTWTLIEDKNGDGTYTIWSSYEIIKEDGSKAYSSVPAICLSPDGKSYVVGFSNVGQHSSTDGGVAYKYYVIANNAETKGYSPSNPQTFNSIEEAQEYYKTLQPKK